MAGTFADLIAGLSLDDVTLDEDGRVVILNAEARSRLTGAKSLREAGEISPQWGNYKCNEGCKPS